MKRKDFIRNTLLGLAMSLVPKILLPVMSELEEEAQAHPQWKLYEEYARETKFVTARSFWWAEYTNGKMILQNEIPATPPVTITINRNNEPTKNAPNNNL